MGSVLAASTWIPGSPIECDSRKQSNKPGTCEHTLSIIITIHNIYYYYYYYIVRTIIVICLYFSHIILLLYLCFLY